jgi:selenide,water dikinase
LTIGAGKVPLLGRAAEFAQQGFVTGASHRNWQSYADVVDLPAKFPEWRRHLLTDPQTSGGLLVAVAPERAEAVLQMIREAGYPVAEIVGFTEAGAPGIRIADEDGR